MKKSALFNTLIFLLSIFASLELLGVENSPTLQAYFLKNSSAINADSELSKNNEWSDQLTEQAQLEGQFLKIKGLQKTLSHFLFVVDFANESTSVPQKILTSQGQFITVTEAHFKDQTRFLMAVEMKAGQVTLVNKETNQFSNLGICLDCKSLNSGWLTTEGVILDNELKPTGALIDVKTQEVIQFLKSDQQGGFQLFHGQGSELLVKGAVENFADFSQVLTAEVGAQVSRLMNIKLSPLASVIKLTLIENSNELSAIKFRDQELVQDIQAHQN